MPNDIAYGYTVTELAERSNLSRATLHRWIKRGWLTSTTANKRYTAADYERACAKSRGEEPAKIRVLPVATARPYSAGFIEKMKAM